ncbi:hypothetical protein ACGF5F_33225 [Streptomyces sp. NPDC047821]|uniref:hypothetical protein n=1 Tax=Streptomyces sp. NPDC047821 TaxID=3365488 RepID=UPI003715265D
MIEPVSGGIFIGYMFFSKAFLIGKAIMYGTYGYHAVNETRKNNRLPESQQKGDLEVIGIAMGKSVVTLLGGDLVNKAYEPYT